MLPRSIKSLIDELNKLPGIGPKSAERLAFYLMKKTDEEIKRLAQAVAGLKEGVQLCAVCYNFADNHDNRCGICSDLNRDQGVLCVVETIPDLVALERIGEFKGLYHVLHGRIDPLHQIEPEHIKLRELQKRVEQSDKIKEIIIATDPDIEGETTAMYIARLFEQSDKKVTRIARGLPTGGNLEFADDMTLRNALKGRTAY